MRRDLGTALVGGGVGGLLDALYATVLWGFILGDNPAGVWQSVAAGTSWWCRSRPSASTHPAPRAPSAR